MSELKINECNCECCKPKSIKEFVEFDAIQNMSVRQINDAFNQLHNKNNDNELISVNTLKELYPHIRSAWKEGDLDYDLWKDYNKSIGNKV